MTKELLILGIIISSFINYLIVKFEIKQNIDLFYALHFEEVERQIKKFQCEKMKKKINSQITKIARHLVRAFL